MHMQCVWQLDSCVCCHTEFNVAVGKKTVILCHLGLGIYIPFHTIPTALTCEDVGFHTENGSGML